MNNFKWVLVASQNDDCIRLEFNELNDAIDYAGITLECGDVKTGVTIVKEWLE